MQSEISRRLLRSKLFVPADRPELFPKALASGADGVCFDLEEAVPAAGKTEARKNLLAFLPGLESATGPAVVVRVNHALSADLTADLEAIMQRSVYAVALPKVESTAEIRRVDGILSQLESERGIPRSIALLITVESPRGLRMAAELASSSQRITGLQLGFADLLEPLGISSTDSAARQHIRLMLRLAAAEANVDCYESAYTLFPDEQGFLAQLRDARSLGFAGASCIHPRQIALANNMFTPTPEEIEYAQNVVNAAEDAERQSSAIAQFEGKMIDRPFVLRARAILAASSSK